MVNFCNSASFNCLLQLALPAGFPVILYAKGTLPHLAAQAATGVRVISVDWTADLAEVRRALPPAVAVQGNLDPSVQPRVSENIPQIIALIEKLVANGHA